MLAILALACYNTITNAEDDSTPPSSDTNFDIELSSAAQQAIDNGVALTFICEVAKVTNIAFITWTTERKQHRFVVTHHALSNRYIVRQDKLQTPHLFRSLAHAIDFMTEQAMELFELYNDHDHQHHMRISLSKYELPGPMRLNAYISSEWDLDSGWKQWVSEK